MKILAILILLLAFNLSANSNPPRLLITTDIGGDPDDLQSLIRLMLYSCEFEIEGIVCSASGTPGELNESIVRPDLAEEVIHAYGQVYPNLIKHHPGYPSEAELMSVVRKGNPLRGWSHIGQGHDTEASEWIIRCADENDPRLLNIAIWGGQTDVAQALWKVKNTRSEKQYRSFAAKLRIYEINDQDRIFSEMWNSFPGLFYIQSKAPEGHDKRNGGYRGVYLGGNEELTSMEWIRNHVLENHGPLGSLYPVKTWTSPNPHGVMKEGDTPSWFYFLKNGLHCTGNPACGGWGGRFQKCDKGYYTCAPDSFQGEENLRAAVYRWRDDFQRDFAARMDWCVRNYNEANHAPAVVVNGNDSREPLIIRCNPGEKIKLDASASGDPDGNTLRFEWSIYHEAGNLKNDIRLNADGDRMEVQLPRLDKDSAVHIILKVTDDGIPELTGYKRIILYNRK